MLPPKNFLEIFDAKSRFWGQFAGKLQCYRSTRGQRYLPERRSGSKIFAAPRVDLMPLIDYVKTKEHCWLLQVLLP